MKKLLLGFAILPFVAGTALAAGQPLTDKQMDKVTAGHTLTLVETTDVSQILINVGVPPVACATCYIDVILPLTTLQVASRVIP